MEVMLNNTGSNLSVFGMLSRKKDFKKSLGSQLNHPITLVRKFCLLSS